MITTERERLKRAIEQDCLVPAHSNAAYVQSLKQALTEVRLWFCYAFVRPPVGLAIFPVKRIIF